MSVLTRKPVVSEPDGLRGHAAKAARQVAPIATKVAPLAQQAQYAAQQAAHQAVPLAKQAVPLARTAGASARHGADSTVAWATPLVEAARSWTAPQLEQAAHAISESIAPMISDALLTAAHKIDVPRRKQRHRARLVALSLLATAAASAGAVVAMRRWQDSNGFPAAADGGDPSASEGPGYDIDRSPDPDMNGNGGQRVV
ncbi:MAG TPA: hypothetical protein VGI66_05325 [Streptosporangiaceae bacterium]